MSIPRHVTRLATAAFLAGIRAVDLLALMPPPTVARFCANAGLSPREYLEAMRWLANHFTLQHHTELLGRRSADIPAPAAPSVALAVGDATAAGLLT